MHRDRYGSALAWVQADLLHRDMEIELRRRLRVRVRQRDEERDILTATHIIDEPFEPRAGGVTSTCTLNVSTINCLLPGTVIEGDPVAAKG
jgi:hypothetical protein